MKPKNNLKTGILIGIGIIVLPLILTSFSTTNIVSEVGTYQMSNTYRENGNWIFETVYDSRTGEVISRKRMRGFKDYVTE
jgi:hypothetical protein